MEVALAQPRGFCAGVVRAVDIVDRALQIYGAPVYVFHEIVHNRHVVEDLRSRGAIFIDDLADAAPGSVTIFSAHGVSNAIEAEARRRQLRVIDATCPLVAKVHMQAQRYSRMGYTVVMIGHRGHEEVEGTLGSIDGPTFLVSTLADVAALPLAADAALAYVTQTTLSLDDTRALIDALQARFANIEGPDVSDICYATQNRQNAVRAMAPQVDVVLVVGAANSSNSNRLREVAALEGVPAYLIEDASQIVPAWIPRAARVGVTAGASAPETLVTAVCDRLRDLGATTVADLPGVREKVSFRLPREVLISAGGLRGQAQRRA